MRRIAIWLRLCLFTLCLSLVSGATAHSGSDLTEEQKQEILDGITNILHTYAFVPNVDFGQWDGYLAKQKDAINKADTDAKFTLAVQAALTKFGLSHTYLVSPAAVEAQEKNSSIGIGVLIAPDKDGLLITRVYANTPADRAGIKSGDVITNVDGQKPDSATAVRGEEGTSATIIILHPNGQTRSLTITRARYSIFEPPTFKEIDKDTAMLKIPTFHTGYSPRQIEDLYAKAMPYKNLVLDLRGNPGGEISHFMHLMGLLLPPKTLVGTFIGPVDLMRYRADHTGTIDLARVADDVPDERREHVAAGNYPYFKGHIAVLINRSSGSASEMAACALRDNANATVVGTHSAGAVLISVIRDLPDGFRLQYPIRDYITSGRKRLEGTGVDPDITVAEPRLTGDADEPLKRAVAIVEKLSQNS